MSGDEGQDEVVKITSITVKIGDVSVDVTLDEARKLKLSLDEIFPAEMAPIQIHYRNDPFYVPSQPYGPCWIFGDVETSGDIRPTNTCSATLNIQSEGNIIT